MQVKENRFLILPTLGNRLSDFEIDLNGLKTRMVRTNFKTVAFWIVKIVKKRN